MPGPCLNPSNSLLTVLDLCLFMPDPHLLDPVSLFLTDERSDAAGDPVTKPWESRLCLRFEAGTIGSLQDLGLYKNNKELMTEDDFGKTSLKTW